jgi:hypothetical protein
MILRAGQHGPHILHFFPALSMKHMKSAGCGFPPWRKKTATAFGPSQPAWNPRTWISWWQVGRHGFLGGHGALGDLYKGGLSLFQIHLLRLLNHRVTCLSFLWKWRNAARYNDPRMTT